MIYVYCHLPTGTASPPLLLASFLNYGVPRWQLPLWRYAYRSQDLHGALWGDLANTSSVRPSEVTALEFELNGTANISLCVLEQCGDEV